MNGLLHLANFHQQKVYACYASPMVENDLNKSNPKLRHENMCLHIHKHLVSMSI